MNLHNTALSYGIGTEGNESDPSMHLAIDRNLMPNTPNGVCTAVNFMVTKLYTTGRWTSDLHTMQGNVGLTDGSVQEWSQPKLTVYLSTLNGNSSDPNYSNCTLLPY